MSGRLLTDLSLFVYLDKNVNLFKLVYKVIASGNLFKLASGN